MILAIPKNEVGQNHEYNEVNDRYPESLARRIGRNPRDNLTQLEVQNGNDDSRIDCSSHQQIGCERKATEPRTHRTLQDEQ